MPRAPSIRHLLASGIVAGTLFPSLVLVQALTREGFDLARHPLSMLSLGGPGWIQTANFVVTGALMIGFAVGLRRSLGSSPGGRWGPRLLGFNGIVNVAAGVFPVDPMYGFPPGAPEGLPDTLSWHAMVHNVTFVFAFLALIAVLFVFARRFVAKKQWGFATISVVAGLATPGLIVVSQMMPDVAGYILFGMGAMINAWIVLLATRMLAEHRALRVAGSAPPAESARRL